MSITLVPSDELVRLNGHRTNELLEMHGWPRSVPTTGFTGVAKCRQAMFDASPAPVLPDWEHREAAKRRACGRCEFCGRRRAERCGGLERIEAPTAWAMTDKLEVEHGVPKQARHTFRVRNDVIESIANLTHTHASINGLKSGAALTAEELAGLWKVHRFGFDDPHAPALLMVSDLMTPSGTRTERRWRLPVLDDLVLPAREAPALGAFARQKRLPEIIREVEAIERALARDWRNGLMVDAERLEFEHTQTHARQAQAHRRRVLRAASKRMPA